MWSPTERRLLKFAGALRDIADRIVYTSAVGLLKQATGGNQPPSNQPPSNQPPSNQPPSNQPPGNQPLSSELRFQLPPGLHDINQISREDLHSLRQQAARMESQRQLQALDRLDRELGQPVTTAHQRQVITGGPLLRNDKSFLDRMGFSPEVAAVGTLGATAGGIYLVKKILERRRRQQQEV